ncbi:MAG: DUF5686 family protein [Paludibacteraceae bacterium]
MKNNTSSIIKRVITLLNYRLTGLVSCFLFFSFSLLSAQETIVVGQALNKFDRTPLEFVSVYFKGANAHVQTNEEGYFLIRNRGKESVLVFSLIGYDKEEIKIKPGESVGVEILLNEKDNTLNELFVRPGNNPADNLMKKVRRNRKRNDVRTNLKSNEQSVVFLSKNDSRWQNKRLFDQFKKGNLTTSDSALIVPLYMEESEYTQTHRKKEQISKNTFNTPTASQNIISGLLNGLSTDLNFYDNSISILGKNMISPLANVGGTFYRYYLLDSIHTDSGKEYLLHFRSKNTKNLAFNGEMRFDSASYALTYMNAELPRQANLNYIHSLRLNQHFQQTDNYWIPQKENSTWYMTYEMLKEVNTKSPELFISRNSTFSPEGGKLVVLSDSFANSAFSQQQLQAKMESISRTPLYKTAGYIADVLLTGYARIGIFDVGPVISIARLTKIEGVRLGLPVRTNEYLWKNVMLGGHLAYGFRDNEPKYTAEMQWKLPVKNKRVVFGTKYVNDYRRIDYDYNNFLWRENPLADGDENIVTTIFSFKEQHRISRRKEFSAFIFNDWTPDIESKLIYRDVTYFPNELLSFTHDGAPLATLRDKNLSLTARVSFGERSADEHFRRLYFKSDKPIIYATLEAGEYLLEDNKNYYGKVGGTLMQQGHFSFGEWRYMLEAGKIFGNVPYPMLKFIQGKNTGYYNRFEFSMMNSREYIADTYATLFSEIITNGIVFNNIPLIKHLNLREIAGVKLAYGTLHNPHRSIMDIPPPPTGLPVLTPK